MPQQQPVHERVGQSADADLKGAAVAHQRAGLQAEGELDRLHRLARQREQRVRGRRIVKQQVEEPLLHLGLVADEGHRGVNDSDHQRPRPPAGLHGVQQILRDVRIARQTPALAFGPGPPRHQLRDDVDAHFGQVARGVGVVQADVLALRVVVAEQRAGLEIELADPHVGRQPTGAARLGVLQIGIVGAEVAVEERLEEAPLEIGPGHGPRQRESGEEVQGESRLRDRAAVERIEEHVRLAEAERRGHPQIGAGPRQNPFYARVDATHSQGFRHAVLPIAAVPRGCRIAYCGAQRTRARYSSGSKASTWMASSRAASAARIRRQSSSVMTAAFRASSTSASPGARSIRPSARRPVSWPPRPERPPPYPARPRDGRAPAREAAERKYLG